MIPQNPLVAMIDAYDSSLPLEEAWTIPKAWYTDARLFELERAQVFGRAYQPVARAEQLAEPGQFITADVAGEPVVVVRGRDGALRAFFNVCRHKAAAVVTEAAGRAQHLRCPYHGFTYSLEGELKGAPDFEGVCNFDKASSGLVPVSASEWEGFIFVSVAGGAPSLEEAVAEIAPLVKSLRLGELRFYERRAYDVDCNWKVYVDNYLDGGYHVPHVHKGLHSVLDFASYSIEARERSCVQSSELGSKRAKGADPDAAAARTGSLAHYFWIYPGFMINGYEGYMDTNWVVPLAVDRTRVVFDYYFAASGGPSEEERRQSIAVAERIQDEDKRICESVQRGLGSRAFEAGRLSVRREAGQHLFHRLLASDLREAVGGKNSR